MRGGIWVGHKNNFQDWSSDRCATRQRPSQYTRPKQKHLAIRHASEKHMNTRKIKTHRGRQK